MLKRDVQVGRVYVAKISNRLVPVQLIQAYRGYNGRTYWRALNLATGRTVRINSAAKLRREVDPDRLSPRAYGRMY
jgi:hypothetical protein